MVVYITLNNKGISHGRWYQKKCLRQAIERFRRQFGDQPSQALDVVLPTRDVQQLVLEEVGPFRERIYPPLTTLGLFLGQALAQDGACQDAVARRLSERVARKETACSLNSGPYCKARQRLPLGLVRRLAQMSAQTLEQQSRTDWKWRGRSVKLVDGTTLSMPDTASNQAAYPQSGSQKTGLGFPRAMLVAMISLATGAVLDWALGPCKGKNTGEQALFRELMPSLAPADIVLADRYHCTYFTAALLVERGVDFVMQQHQCRKTDFQRGRSLGHQDHVVQWKRPARPSWMSAQTYESMPKSLSMRELKAGGRILVTTLTDAKTVTRQDIDALYKRRWQVELDLRSIKAVMGMDILRTRSAPMVNKEVAVYLLAYNLMCALMVRAAAQSGVQPRTLSFKGTVQLHQAFEQHLRIIGRTSASIMTAHMLGAMSLMRLRSRPGRVEPRAVKRRPKSHDLLTVPRSVARQNILTAWQQSA